MSYGAAGRCLAFSFSLALLGASESHAQNEAPAPRAQPQEQQAPAEPPPVIQEPETEAGYSEVSCERPKAHDAADLCEQRRMAQSAEDAVWWARLQTWIAGLGFTAVVISLFFTVVATRAASRSARAAERALNDLERPFIYVEVTNRGFHVLGDGRLSAAGNLAFECVNLGRTPADLLDISDTIIEADSGTWPDPVVPTTGPRGLPPGTVSAPDRPRRFTINIMGEHWSVTRGRVGIDTNVFLIGYVRYADVFGARYLTGFCAIYDIVSGDFVLRGDKRYNYSHRES